MTPEEQAELVRATAKLMGGLLIARRDVKAIENPGGWMPEREPCDRHAPSKRCALCNEAPCVPFKMADFHSHLLEQRCLGTYLLDLDDNVKFIAFDVDLKTEGAEWWEIAETDDESTLDLTTYSGNLEVALHDPTHLGFRWARMLLRMQVENICTAVERELSLPTIPVITGGGAHVLVPFGALVPAREARAAARAVMEAAYYKLKPNGGDNFWISESPSFEIEVFPKQDTISKSGQSFGNLIRLPLGWHRAAKMRTYFLDLNAPGDAWALPKASSLLVLETAAAAVGVGV